MLRRMNEPNESPRRYRWPWYAVAAVVLFVVLTVVWMSFAVKRERQERDFNAPLPNSTPVH
jgi:bacteriorhodopsin